MYGYPRKQLPSSHRIAFNSNDVVLTAQHVTSKTSTKTGHNFINFDLVFKSAARYNINLSEEKTISLNREAIHPGYTIDDSSYFRAGSYINQLVLVDYKYPSSGYPIIWVIQQADDDDFILKYPGKRHTQLTNNYVSSSTKMFLTPIEYNGNNFIPPSIGDIYPELLNPQLDLSDLLPNTYSIKRANPEFLNLPASERRAEIGFHTGWVDEDGPISFLNKEISSVYAEKINSNSKIKVLKINSEPNPKNGSQFESIEIRFKDYQPGMLIPINRYLACVGPNGEIFELDITQFIHLDLSYQDLKFNKDYAYLSAAINILVEDLYEPQSFWDQHPKNLEQYKSAIEYYPNQLNCLSKNFFKTLNASKYPNIKYTDILKNNNDLREKDWKNLNFSKLLVRTEKGRTYKKALIAAQNKEQALLNTEIRNKQYVDRRIVILEARKKEIAELKRIKETLLLKEKEIIQWNRELEKLNNQLDIIKKDYSTISTLAEKAYVSEQDILDELGISHTPNIRQIWLKQNWIVLDLIYKNKISGITTSIKQNDKLSLNTNWFLCQVVARTIRPNIIKVGARDPNWENKYGSVVGGPYKFTVTVHVPGSTPIIEIFPAETGTICGVKNKLNNRNAISLNYKLHPHTAECVLNTTATNVALTFFDVSARICAGEATTALYQCFQTEDLNLILLTLNSWVSNADPNDDWGKFYIWFPKPDEVPCVKYKFSFEKKKIIYSLSSSDVNHLFYEIIYTDGLPGINIRFGSMINHGYSWIVPETRGRSITIECTTEEVLAEVQKRLMIISKKGYTEHTGILVNETAKIEKVLKEQQENNEGVLT